MDHPLQNVRTRGTMEAGGWITSGAPDQIPSYYAKCGGSNNFWGFAGGEPNGFVEATFRGSGNAILGFGNCVECGVTNVYLNGKLIGSAGPHQNSHVNFKYKGGDILRVTEEKVGVIRINSLKLSCQSKYNKFLSR